MQDVCSTSLPASIPSRTVVRGTQPIPDNAPRPTPAPCTGQEVQPNSGMSCRKLADQYAVPLGAIYAAIGGTSMDCTNMSAPLCLPNPCELEVLDSPEIWDQTWYEWHQRQFIVTRLKNANGHQWFYCQGLQCYRGAISVLESVYPWILRRACVWPERLSWTARRPVFAPGSDRGTNCDDRFLHYGHSSRADKVWHSSGLR